MKITSRGRYSTNNAWGFGGSYGTETRFEDGWVVRKGTACYRHLRSHPITYAITPAGVYVKDLHEAKTKPEGLPEHVWAEVRKKRAKTEK